VLLNGLGLLWMLITGASLVLQRWRQGPRPAKSAGPEGSA
jgi:hypothetical protein